MAEAATTPKVFISYSWTSEAHVDWVVRLAERLVADGVDVVLDQWDLKEGQDKYAFMERMVTDRTVSKVLAVCDETYADKADGRRGGVGTETQIISKDIYEKVQQEKFIPLIRERDANGKEFVPVFFRNRKYIDFSTTDEMIGESYDKLLRNIFGRPERKKPQLGQPPADLFAEDATHVKTAGKLERLKDAVLRQKPHTQAILQEYLELFASSMEDFRIVCDGKNDPPFDEQVVASVKAFLPYRDNFLDFLIFVAHYMDDDESYDRIAGFLESILPYSSRPESMHSWNEVSFDNYRFILYELFLYLVAILIKVRRYAAAARFMEAEYVYTESLGGAGFVKNGADAFNQPIRSLDEFRKHRLKLNRFSVVADLIVERATYPKISFRELFQADFFLFLRDHFLPSTKDYFGWYARCIGYGGRMGTLEIFAKASSPTGFEALRHMLKVRNLEDFAAKMQRMFSSEKFVRVMQSLWYQRFSVEQLMNLQNLLEAAKKK